MKQYKYLGLLICLAVVMAVIANTIAGKITHIGFLTLSAGSLCIPATYIIGDALTEVYGYRHARRATWIVIAACFLVAAFYQLAVYLPPAPGSAQNEAFTTVLSMGPRVALGALAALFAGQFINDYVLAKMKVLTKGKYLWARTIGSTIAGQAADSSLFYIIALYAVIPNGLLFTSILSAWFAKVVIEVAITPVTYVVAQKLKKAEGIDHFDRHTNFNPFIFGSRKA
jgi:queuosine precursor transporter